MNAADQKKAPAPGFIAAAVYNIISILLFPITVLGYVFWGFGATLGGRGSGISGTAQGPLSARFFAHQLGTRRDEAANRLMLSLPNVPPLGLRLFTWPMVIAHRLSGYVPKAFRYPFEGEIPREFQASARMTFFDKVVEQNIPPITQFVILGAGFDTRALHLPKDAKVRSFEVDMPKTQAVKRETLEKAGIDTAGITFVPADFEKDDWLARLVEAGFDLKKPALFIWEGVMVYLDRGAVEETLRKIASTAKGSIIAFDYFTVEPLLSNDLYWRFGRAATSAGGEPFKFGIDSTPPSRERIAELLQSCGLSLAEQITLGQETEGKRAWGGFATAIVK